MFQTTLRVLDEHADAYAANKALTAAVATFQAEVDVLDPENLAQRPESGGLTAVKKKTRLRVAAAAHNIGAALYAYAADPAHEDLPLQAAVDYTQRTLERKPGADLVRLGRLLVLHRPRPRRSSLPRPCRQLIDLFLLGQKIYIST